MAKRSKLIDIDGNEYVDFWIGHLALILGHSPEPVIEAVRKQIENGTHFGTCHPLEVELAEEIVKLEGGWHGGYDALDIDVQVTGRKLAFPHTLQGMR